MAEFLTLLPPGDALARLLDQLPETVLQEEVIETKQAVGRVVARPVTATEPLPAYPRSSVDGFAVLASDSYGASDGLPAYLQIVGEVPMGRPPWFRIEPGQAAAIFTGGMLPDGADAVIMLEMTQFSRPGELEALRAVAPGENVLRRGEDVEAGEIVIAAGRRLRAAEIGGLLALGMQQVWVAAEPRVAILSTGDELVAPDQSPGLGQVRDINTAMLSALAAQHGGLPVPHAILPDRRADLQAALGQALQRCDAVVITAGSSLSTRDLTAGVIAEFGPPGVIVHGVNVKPGKPTILAICQGKPVIGLPGNPVSALVIARLFLVPLLQRMLGMDHDASFGNVLQARITANLPSQTGREDWTPARLIHTSEGGWLAEPVFYKSNLIFTLAQADGLIYTPADASGLEAGMLVRVEQL